MRPDSCRGGSSGASSDLATTGGRLRRRWWLVAFAKLVLVAGGASVIAGTLGPQAGWQWAVGAVVVVGFVLATFRRHLPRNHPPGSPGKRYDAVGVATAVTLVRGGLIALVAGFLLVEPTVAFAWVPALCYGAVAALDWIDGHLARYADRTTVLGERLDMAMDTTGLLVAALVGVRWGAIPVWYLLVPVARYVYRAALGLRERRGLPVDDLPESRVRRPVAGLQMAFVTGALIPVVPVNAVRMAATIAVAIGLSVFLRDYLAVTRRLR